MSIGQGFNVNVGLIGHGKSLNTAVVVEGKEVCKLLPKCHGAICQHIFGDAGHSRQKGQRFLARAVDHRKVSVIRHVLPAGGNGILYTFNVELNHVSDTKLNKAFCPPDPFLHAHLKIPPHSQRI